MAPPKKSNKTKKDGKKINSKKGKTKKIVKNIPLENGAAIDSDWWDAFWNKNCSDSNVYPSRPNIYTDLHGSTQIYTDLHQGLLSSRNNSASVAVYVLIEEEDERNEGKQENRKSSAAENTVVDVVSTVGCVMETQEG